MSTEWEDEKVSIGKRTSYSMIWLYDYILIAGQFILLFHYYEVELGLSVALLGLAFIIFAIWNMINDPLIGFLTDKPMRWSKNMGCECRGSFLEVFLLRCFMSFYTRYLMLTRSRTLGRYFGTW